jgi:YggT family protein
MQISFRGDPLLRILTKVTDPALQFLYNFIPGWKHIDFAAIVLMLCLKMSELTLIIWLFREPNPGLIELFLLAIINLLSLGIYIFMFAIIIRVLLTWITSPDSYNPLSDLLYYMTEPLLRPVRRKLQPMQSIDFSPLIAIILLQLADILVIGLLRQIVT